MGCSVGCGCRSDIPALYVPDHAKALLFAQVYCLFESGETGNAELLIHCDLRLHGRNQIRAGFHDTDIEAINDFRRCFQRLAVLRENFLLYMIRHKREHRIKSDYDRCICLFNVFN